jgi:hypothetical protein
MMRRLYLVFLFGLLFSPLVSAQLATVLRDGEIRHEPFSDAGVVSAITARSQVQVVQRQGGWYQVRDPQGRLGWLRMSMLRLGEAQDSATLDAQGLSQTRQLLQTGRSGSSGTTVATGIRGLDAEDVSRASPDHQALARLARYQIDPATARSFAQQAQLRAQGIGYLPEKTQ